MAGLHTRFSTYTGVAVTFLRSGRSCNPRRTARGVCWWSSVLALLPLVTCLALSSVQASGVPGLVPWPKSVQMQAGEMRLGEGSRIVARDASLLPLARVLSDEILLVARLRLQPVVGKDKPGDVALELDPTLTGEQYRLAVGDTAVVSGGDYHSVALGTATLLQAITAEGGQVVIPHMSIEDQPDAPYRGMMVDVARQWQPVEVLEKWVVFCRQYKVRYLHLHLTDDHGWTFPSTAFPRLGSANSGAHGGIAPKLYSREELLHLVRFADERGVTIIPEIEGPGHSGAMRIPMPEQFDSPKQPGGEAWLGVLNMASERTYSGMDTIIGEVAEVFKSSPYIHIGCDEVWVQRAELAKEYGDFIKEHGLKNSYDLFAYYCARMVDIVKQHGKKAIAWEGFATDRADPKDVILMAWNGDTKGALRMVAAGFSVINVPWYQNGAPPEVQYGWDMYNVNGAQCKRTDPVIGGQLVAWEHPPVMFGTFRPLLPARTETFWNAPPSRPYEDYASRFQHTDALLDALIEPVKVHAQGLISERPQPGGTGWPKDFSAFVQPMTITMESSIEGASIRYTLDGSKPTLESAPYAGPITVDKTTTVRAALFNADGQRLGTEQMITYRWVNYEKNLTTGKPVTASSAYPDLGPQMAVDGYAEKDSYWDCSPGVAPQWLKVDLQEEHILSAVQVFTYWDGRYYQYIVEVSPDGDTWSLVGDMSTNTSPATDKGDQFEFAPIKARYIRVTMLKNSANPGLHISEVRAYEAK